MAEIINARRMAQGRAEDIAVEGAPKGFLPMDLFSALAQIVCDRNPELGFSCLRALESIVKSHLHAPTEPAKESNIIHG